MSLTPATPANTDKAGSPKSVRQLLSQAVGLPLLLMAILSAFLISEVSSLLSATRWVDRTDQAISQAYEIKSQLVDLESGLRGYVITHDPVFRRPYTRAQNTVDRGIMDFRNFISDNPEQVQRADVLRATLSQWRSYSSRVLSIMDRDGNPTPLLASGEGRVLMEAMRRQIQSILVVEEHLRIERSQSAQALARWVISLTIVVFVLIGIFMAVFTRRQLLRLTRVHREAQEVLRHATAEEARRKTEAKYRLLVDSMRDYAILMLDPRGYVTSWNAGAEKIEGYKANEIIGQHFSKFYTMEDIQAGKPSREIEVATREGRFEDEGWRVRKDGSRFWANVIVTTLKDPEGNPQGFVKVTRDLTERRKAEDQLRNSAIALTAANKELEAFSYAVSHDLRSPLRGIDGFSQALMEDYGDKLDPTAMDYLTRVRSGVQKMGRLIDDLLNLSRLTRAEMRREKVDLSAMATQIVAELRKSDPGRKVEVHIMENLKAEGDPGLVAAALQNLISNSWKFTSAKANGRIEIGSQSEDGDTIYFVRDNGAGFDMAFSDKLFGAFQRLHRASEFSGTGVGLATVRRIIHRHGGQIWAEAKVGEGATFFFTLKPSQKQREAA